MRRVAATSSYMVDFRPQRVPGPERVGRVPRVARLLALAHKIDEMIRTAEIENLATAAQLCGVTRARMTQVMNLFLLAPAIQEEILDLPSVTRGRDPITERNLRGIVGESVWDRQLTLWRRLAREQKKSLTRPDARAYVVRDRPRAASAPGGPGSNR